MDHEVVPCSPKICDWPLNSSRDHFHLHQGKKEKKNLRVTMEFEVFKRFIFRRMLSTVMVQTSFAVRKAKWVLSLQKTFNHGKEMPC